MALDDYLEPEVAVAVAVTAAVASPTVRKVLRRGLVYGLAGLLIARDKVEAVAGSVAQGAREATAHAERAMQPAPVADQPAGSTQPVTEGATA